jgi:hybrid cluster-associated redox disulfide protein
MMLPVSHHALTANFKDERGKKQMVVTKKSVIGDILDAAPSTAPYFTEIGMHCLGCPHSRGETIEQACAVHDTDADALVEQINRHLSAR